jgi:adenine-specific DNA-methyltransferase
MKAPASLQKLRGGYYTPDLVARFISNWAIRSRDSNVLEPGCGDGNIMESASEALVGHGLRRASVWRHLTGVELDRFEAAKTQARLGVLGVTHPERAVVTGDFFRFCLDSIEKGKHFDSVVGNPPFVRYQDFTEPQRETAFQIMSSAGLHPNRLTNAWVPFVVGSTLLLNNPGRLGMVVPAELLQVGYAAELRRFLTDNFSRITLVTFRRLLFGAVQQEVVLLLGEKNGSDWTGTRTVEFEDASQLATFREAEVNASPLKPMDHSSEKWTQYFLNTEQIELFRALQKETGLVRLGDLASVDVGIVTGVNEFFVLTEGQVGENGLAAFVRPLVARSSHLSGLRFTKRDWEDNAQSGLTAYLLDVQGISRSELPSALMNYIEQGEARGFHRGYKCSIRDPWWEVPSTWIPGGFFLRQIHEFPKMIVNHAEATSTDTVHRVKISDGCSPASLAVTMLNSLTFAHAELVGRSYGGGVLELEPREAERLLVPSTLLGQSMANTIDSLVREGKISEVLDITDSLLLRDQLGLSAKKVLLLRTAWETLRERRNGRRQPEREGYSVGRSEPLPRRNSGIAST